jgi:hypothetical protein
VTTECWKDVALHHSPATPSRALLEPQNDMLSIEAFSQLRDREYHSVGVALGGRVFAVLCSSDERDCPIARLSSDVAPERETAASKHQLGNGNLPY